MKVIFLSTFKFPDNDAGSLRYSFLSKLFAKNGYTPYFIGKGKTSINTYTNGRYGFYTSLKSKSNNLFSRAFDTLYSFERKIVKEVKRISEPNDIIVIACFFSKTTNTKIIKFATKNNIKVLFAVEEKYSKTEFRKHDFISLSGFKKCESFYKNIQYYKRPIIAISSYIGEFARRANVPHIVIPFIYDEDLIISINDRKQSNLVKFFYAGAPGKKDLLLEMIEGFALLPPDCKRHIEFDIFGITSKYASTWLPNDLFNKTRDFIKFNGIVSREQIKKEIANADFSVLLRNSDEEFAKAGFPTKISESLFYGVPVITNISSDLGQYLKNGFNSIIVKGYDKKAFCESIKLALNMSRCDLMNLKKNARDTSIKYLTTDCFDGVFRNFLLSLNNYRIK